MWLRDEGPDQRKSPPVTAICSQLCSTDLAYIWTQCQSCPCETQENTMEEMIYQGTRLLLELSLKEPHGNIWDCFTTSTLINVLPDILCNWQPPSLSSGFSFSFCPLPQGSLVCQRKLPGSSSLISPVSSAPSWATSRRSLPEQFLLLSTPVGSPLANTFSVQISWKISSCKMLIRCLCCSSSQEHLTCYHSDCKHKPPSRYTLHSTT